jgi:hypothetical protein
MPWPYFRAANVLLALTVASYRTSLNANKNAAVSTLWVTFGPIPDYISIGFLNVGVMRIPP